MVITSVHFFMVLSLKYVELKNLDMLLGLFESTCVPSIPYFFFTCTFWRTWAIWPAELPPVWMLLDAYSWCSSTCSSVLRLLWKLAARFRTGSKDSWIQVVGRLVAIHQEAHNIWLSLCYVNSYWCLMQKSIHVLVTKKLWCFNLVITFID